MGSIRIHPEKAVVATGFYVESFVNRCPCGLAQQPRSPHLLINMIFRPVEFRKKSFTDLSRRFSRVEPLRSLPGGPRISYTETAAPISDDGVQRGDESKSTSPESSSESQRVSPPVLGEKQKQDSKNAAQSALERAAAYKKLKKLGSSLTAQSGQSLAPPKRPETDLPEIEFIRGQNVQSRLQATNSFRSSLSESSTSTPPGSSSPIPDIGSAREAATPSESQDADNIDIGRFIEEKMAAERVTSSDDGAARTAVPGKGKLEPVSLAAFERAKAYEQQQEDMLAALRGEALDESSVSSSKEGSPDQSAGASNKKVMEIEIVTRDGVIRRKVMNPEEQMRAFSNIKDVKRKGVSGIHFAGLGFADKKESGRSAGLSEGFVAPPTGALPEVEILTRDAGSPQTESAEQSSQDAEQLYKPRVSTWGVFPRPADISKAYGGGRTIRPGESLETEEERQVREARTQKLLADYRKKMGLDVHPKIKAEAEQVFKQGDGLMDNGRLREALMLYESAMNKMPAQSELHGRAALQAAVCLDSLSRYDDARQVYERLLAHPNGAVKKQARRFLFGFTDDELAYVFRKLIMRFMNVEDQTPAMEKLKVDGGYKWDTSLYRKYFDSFAEDGYNTTYKAEDGEEANENVLPYALLLLCPILLVFALAASRSG